jgi:hypothetical protein
MKDTMIGARVGAALVVGFVGFAIGPVSGSLMAGFASGRSGDPAATEVGRFVGMGAGLIGGALFGAFLVGRPMAVAGAVVGLIMGYVLGLGFACGLLDVGNMCGMIGVFITAPLGVVVGGIAG